MFKEGKLDMEIVLNATLAGGVCMGANSDIILSPFGAFILGGITGIISSLGFIFLSPLLQRKFGLHDTCGVLNLHGIPGVIGGVVSAILAFISNTNGYYPWGHQTAAANGGYQLAALVTTLTIAILSGLLTGFLTSRPFFHPIPVEQFHNDPEHWQNVKIEHH